MGEAQKTLRTRTTKGVPTLAARVARVEALVEEIRDRLRLTGDAVMSKGDHVIAVVQEEGRQTREAMAAGEERLGRWVEADGDRTREKIGGVHKAVSAVAGKMGGVGRALAAVIAIVRDRTGRIEQRMEVDGRARREETAALEERLRGMIEGVVGMLGQQIVEQVLESNQVKKIIGQLAKLIYMLQDLGESVGKWGETLTELLRRTAAIVEKAGIEIAAEVLELPEEGLKNEDREDAEQAIQLAEKMMQGKKFPDETYVAIEREISEAWAAFGEGEYTWAMFHASSAMRLISEYQTQNAETGPRAVPAAGAESIEVDVEGLAPEAGAPVPGGAGAGDAGGAQEAGQPAARGLGELGDRPSGQQRE